MNKAIIRIQKIKSRIAFKRSMQHVFRERDTPNANPELTKLNTNIGANDTANALMRFQGAMPAKVRKNAVLAVEYLITGSPDAIKGRSPHEQDEYFNDAVKWLKKKHGEENILHVSIHRDEETPHMHVHVIPKDEKGQLNCRSFFGGAKKLSELQTDFAKNVGVIHQLQRGLKGSKTKHTSIKQFYAKVNRAMPPEPSIDVPEPLLFESKKKYSERIVETVKKQLRPEYSVIRSKAEMMQSERNRRDIAEKELQYVKEINWDLERKLRSAEQDIRTLENKLDAEKKRAMESMTEVVQLIVNGGHELDAVQYQLRQKHRPNQESQEKKHSIDNEQDNDLSP